MVPNVLIYHTDISKESTPDDLDVLDEAKFVSDNLIKLGYKVEQRPFKYNKNETDDLKEINPSFIFNLVESVDGKDSLAYLAPFRFERFRIPYTGCTASSFLKTERKTQAKEKMRENGILTPYWLTLKDFQKENIPKKKFILKSNLDHASKNLESTLLDDQEELRKFLSLRGGYFFAEEYIEGREFNISMIGPIKKGNVLPIAEMTFVNWPLNKPKIIDYEAKWNEDSHESKNTVRNFNFPDSDKSLIKNLNDICKKCWTIFDLRGYARVDFRVDKNNRPYVLEINVNPCISPDAGFVAASHKAGMTDEQIIRNIIKDSCGKKFVL